MSLQFRRVTEVGQRGYISVTRVATEVYKVVSMRGLPEFRAHSKEVASTQKTAKYPFLNSVQLSSKEGAIDLGEPPPTLPTVGTNLTDLFVQRKKLIVRELGGCMGPIWPSYYADCSSVMFVIDASNPTQVSASCVQLLSVLSAEPLLTASVLILFNKIDLPCYMSIVEMKSLFRMNNIIACAKQPVTVLETTINHVISLPFLYGFRHWYQAVLTQGVVVLPSDHLYRSRW
ncbi:hypothetical protein NDU88_007170 [Pleurodeles waltl]|uniref:ADP-ribosylation factor-like protein 16 n=1 Tax=Pleurodeles waltl TaxID=8319 RepID=A0AAV7PTB1_PLEWA|nr:hypothetical protein NDU88_007170 [Pleurodeles waltl]